MVYQHYNYTDEQNHIKGTKTTHAQSWYKNHTACTTDDAILVQQYITIPPLVFLGVFTSLSGGRTTHVDVLVVQPASVDKVQLLDLGSL